MSIRTPCRTFLLGLFAVFGATAVSFAGHPGDREGISPLAQLLANKYDKVKNRSREYLEKPTFVHNTALRWITAADSNTTHHPGAKGLPIQKGHILLLLKPDATEEGISNLLEKYHLEVVSGVKEIGLLVVAVGPGTAAAAKIPPIAPALNLTSKPDLILLEGTKQVLNNEPVVQQAALNVPLATTSLPPATQGSGVDSDGGLYFWDWSDAPGSPSKQVPPRNGNYGQLLVRFPAGWNFNDFIQKNIAKGTGKRTHVAILDVGFNDHEDLEFTKSIHSSNVQADHGNHVMGIIAAKFNNGIGVNGGTPFAQVTVCSAPNLSSATVIPEIYTVLSDVIATLIDLILEEGNQDLKVINLSLGYNWVPIYGRNPNTNREIQELVASHGVIVRAVANLAARNNIILVTAAGNDSDPTTQVEAQWASPFNWAALNKGHDPTPATNIVVVESIGRDPTRRSSFSNTKGCVSAPGEKILSAVAFDQSHTAVNNRYAAYNGTSMAAPHVTALICQMYAYNPDLTMNKVLDILNVRQANRPFTAPLGEPDKPAPIIDAFDAMVQCQDDCLKHLADLNNDGKVDMADFLIFKKALKAAEAGGDNVFPRADLNGSGKVSRDPADKRSVKGEMLSDLEIMMKVWQDPSVPAANLKDMLNQP